jgi:uncharacterized SAM-binding protein YcdF (DUF218 family)
VARRLKSGRILIAFALIFAATYLAGFVVFVTSFPTIAGKVKRADGVVALTGGDVRITAANNLFESNIGKRLLISGVHQGITKEHIKRLVHGGSRFDCCVDLGFEATNTRGNALETANWVREHDFHSIVVVTANYHMPRSLLEFTDVMPDVKLLPYPVLQEDVDTRDWLTDPHVFRVLQWEYVKYLSSVAVTKLFPTSPARGSATGTAT